MQKVLGSKSRLEKIVFDIVKDFKIKPRLANSTGNAMLVSGSIYQACKYYELFQNSGFKDCAIITSYQPHIADVKGETTGEGTITEKALKYEVYKKMLNGKDPDIFEAEAKALFVHEPAKMKLLIVVDKLLTGFDAPCATYLYIDKKMQDHGLFQALCRVNRVHTADKDYGYIIDYKDLFDSIEDSINDYTSNVFDKYDEEDVSGLLKDRFEVSKERLETSLEAIRAICEPAHPKTEPGYIRYFCGNTEVNTDLQRTEELRVVLYKATSGLIRAFSNIANEMIKAGYTQLEANKIKAEVDYYAELRDTIKQASGDSLNFKLYEPGMRQLMDMYLDAKSSKKISDFENQTLVDLIVNISKPENDAAKKKSKEAVSETIENNVRKVIIEESQTNPKYYEKMSKLLDELIKQRKEETISYQEYLMKIKDLATQITKPEEANNYPDILDSPAKRALYDNLDQNEILALALDSVILDNAQDGWKSGGIKQKKLKIAINKLLQDEAKSEQLLKIIEAQNEY
jgi:type I restriction enzyme R subunit